MRELLIIGTAIMVLCAVFGLITMLTEPSSDGSYQAESQRVSWQMEE